MLYTYDDQTYSDLHKDAYGYRPRNDGWEYLSPVGKQIKWDSVMEDVDWWRTTVPMIKPQLSAG